MQSASQRHKLDEGEVHFHEISRSTGAPDQGKGVKVDVVFEGDIAGSRVDPCASQSPSRSIIGPDWRFRERVRVRHAITDFSCTSSGSSRIGSRQCDVVVGARQSGTTVCKSNIRVLWVSVASNEHVEQGRRRCGSRKADRQMIAFRVDIVLQVEPSFGIIVLVHEAQNVPVGRLSDLDPSTCRNGGWVRSPGHIHASRIVEVPRHQWPESSCHARGIGDILVRYFTLLDDVDLAKLGARRNRTEEDRKYQEENGVQTEKGGHFSAFEVQRLR
jgi:hypothetical protein